MLETGTVLVTGASSGIGEAVVRMLARRDLHVLAAARRADRLHAVAEQVGCTPIVLDVRDPEQIAEVADAHPIDVLINNAGLGRAMGSLAEGDAADVERTIGTNVIGLIQMTQAVLPGMIERGRGHVVNISSTLALYPGPASLYGASKGAVHKFCRDLRVELAGTGIRVSEINPGRVATEFYDVAFDDPERRAAAKTTGIVELTPADVAASILHCLDAPTHVNIHQLELAPVEQIYGGARFAPLDGDTP